jgi:hypothetical protein
MGFGQARSMLAPETPHRLAHLAVHFREPEIDAARGQGQPQIDQELGAGEIHERHVAHEEHDQPRRRGALAQQGQHPVAHVIDVEVEERSFGTEHEHVRHALVLGMADEIGKVRGARHASHLRDSGTRGASNEQEQ